MCCFSLENFFSELFSVSHCSSFGGNICVFSVFLGFCPDISNVQGGFPKLSYFGGNKLSFGGIFGLKTAFFTIFGLKNRYFNLGGSKCPNLVIFSLFLAVFDHFRDTF